MTKLPLSSSSTSSSLLSHFRRINSFRLFLWLVGSCSMGWFFILLAFLRQSPSSSSPTTTPIALPTLTLPQSSSNRGGGTVTTNHVASLLQFMNTSAGHVYPKEEPFSDCIYLLTAVFDNDDNTTTIQPSQDATTNAATTKPQSIALFHSLNGYWKHPVGIRRRHLTLNVKLLQDAVQELERYGPAETTDATRILWSVLQATSRYPSQHFITTVMNPQNNVTNDNLNFVAVPHLGMIPIIINWKPTLPFIPRLASSTESNATTTTITIPQQQSACLADDNKVLILRDVIPKRCCGNLPFDSTAKANDGTDDYHESRCSHLTIPNTPLIQQVQAVEQQLSKTAWATCSLDHQGIMHFNDTHPSASLLGAPNRRRDNNNNNNNDNNIVVGLRIPHDDKDPTVQEPFLAWIRHAPEEFRPSQDTSIVWELNQHEDDHDIILDFTFNWTLLCQPHVILLQIDPTSYLDPFTLSLGHWNDSLVVPIAHDDLRQEQQPQQQGKSQNSGYLLESVKRAHAIWKDDAQRSKMLEAKSCWCGQHMKYKVLVDQVLVAWADYSRRILAGNFQLWKEEFPTYAKGHFWKRPGGDSWSLPLSVVGGIKGGLRADAYY